MSQPFVLQLGSSLTAPKSEVNGVLFPFWENGHSPSPRIAQRGCVRRKAAPGRRLFPPGEKAVRDRSVLAAGVGTRLGDAFLALRTAPSDLCCVCLWLEQRNADRF